jgi:hypothetical protein
MLAENNTPPGQTYSSPRQPLRMRTVESCVCGCLRARGAWESALLSSILRHGLGLQTETRPRLSQNHIPRIWQDFRPALQRFVALRCLSPRVSTYVLPEDSLEQLQGVVRTKLGLPPDAPVKLTQIRGTADVDLEDGEARHTARTTKPDSLRCQRTISMPFTMPSILPFLQAYVSLYRAMVLLKTPGKKR